jgi:hypothetical protein
MIPPEFFHWGVITLSALVAGIACVLSPRRDRVVLWLACATLVAHALLYWRFTVDDAFITLRFARSWLHGLGPVFQAGPRVEGVTSLGWTALIALAGLLGAPLEAAAKVLGLAAAAATLPAVHAITLRLTGRPRLAAAATLVLALNPLYASWTVAGMETPLFAALVTWAIRARLERRRVLGLPLDALLFGFSVWIRPEGFLVGALALLSLVADGGPGRRRAALEWVITASAVSVPFWAWRWSYFGAFFPNTFYAKMPDAGLRFAAGARSLLDFTIELGPWAWIPLAASLLRLRAAGAPERFAWLLLGSFLAYVAWSGGDVLHLRFFVHVMPLAAALWASGLGLLLPPWRRAERVTGPPPPGRSRPAPAPLERPTPAAARTAFAAVLVVLACAAGAARHSRALRSPLQFGPGYVVNNARNVQEVNLPLGEWLRAHARPDARLATWDIGGIGWASRLPILDLYGLTDQTLGHMIHDRAPLASRADYVLAARPELIVTYARADGPVWSWLAPAADSIEARYSLHSLWQANTGGYWLVLLARNDVSLPPLAVAQEARPATR